MKLLLPLLLLLLAACPALAQQPDSATYGPTLATIFRALQTKDYALLKPLLDERVSIGTLPQGHNDAVLPQVLAQLTPPTAYRVAAVRPEGDGHRVAATFLYAQLPARPVSFRFDAAGKITDLDILGGAKTQVGMAQLVLFPTHLPDYFEAPFELHEHLIFVKARLNGQEEDFILDSGAPTLMLNATHPAAAAGLTSTQQATGVGGAAAMGVAHIAAFDWQGVQLASTDLITLPLAHLEAQTGHRFAGLIGYALLKDFELTFDYQRQVVRGTRTDAAGQPVGPPRPAPAGTARTVPFVIRRHLPVFALRVGGQSYQVGLDCGAGTNLLLARHMPSLEPQLRRARQASLHGAGQSNVVARRAVLRAATVGETTYPDMKFSFEDKALDQLNQRYGLGIDGLLGYEFLRKYPVVLNFKKGEMRLYEPAK